MAETVDREGRMDQVALKPKKRVFLSLMGVSGLVLLLLSSLVVVGYLFRSRTAGLVLAVVALVGLLLVSYLAVGLFGLFLSATGRQLRRRLLGPMVLATRLLFPVATGLARLFGIGVDMVQSSFVEVTNRLAHQMVSGRPLKNILVLLPHCLQFTGCNVKLKADISNCLQCGKCVISSLKRLSDMAGLCIRVVPGGTVARRILGELRPDAVIAVACERDLAQGIQDALPLPVVGVLNSRPNGPCVDTTVDVERVYEAIQGLIEASGHSAVLEKS